MSAKERISFGRRRVRQMPGAVGRLPMAVACALLAAAPVAQAGSFELDNGVSGVWSMEATLSSGWRATNPDPALIGKVDGGSSSGNNLSPAQLNYGKGDNFTSRLGVIGDVNLKKDNYGLMLRGKAWYDERLRQHAVPFGSPANGFIPNTRLEDGGFDTRLSKFSGLELLDAYAYGTFNLGESSSMKVKIGNHAVNWGESLFISGVNRYSVLDTTALRKPGSLMKEAVLPVPQISVDVGLDESTSLEAFYQFKWKRHVIDGCGTYWSAAHSLNCRQGQMLVAAAPVPTAVGWNGFGPGNAMNERFPLMPDREPKDSGQFGVALKRTVEAIDSELGAYFVNYTNHGPINSSYRTTTSIPGSILAGVGGLGWDYDQRNIKVYGLSLSTAVSGWTLAGELSHTRGFPVQVNTVDTFNALVGNGGPRNSAAGFAAAPPGSGVYIPGYDRKNFTQIQVSTIKSFSNVAGVIPGITLLGEVAYQRWSGIGDPYTSVRYGRHDAYGAAQHAAYGGVCPVEATNPKYCTQDGYATPNAWGLRAQVEFDFPNAFAGVNLKPRIFYSRDVKGWSGDGQFNQGRQTVSLGLKAEYQRKYTLDLSYTRFNQNATFDNSHDRDYFGLALGMSF